MESILNKSEADTFNHLKYRIVTDDTGRLYYYNSDGLLHREDGPAILYPGGYQAWFQNGKLHREDGPAVVNTLIWPPKKEYWMNGKRVSVIESPKGFLARIWNSMLRILRI